MRRAPLPRLRIGDIYIDGLWIISWHANYFKLDAQILIQVVALFIHLVTFRTWLKLALDLVVQRLEQSMDSVSAITAQSHDMSLGHRHRVREGIWKAFPL